MKFSALESFILEKMTDTRLPGLSIAVVKGDRLVYSRGFGQSDIANGKPATPETLYGAASITKSVIAIAILQLAQQRRLKLSDPVKKFVEWPIASSGGPVRIHHFLTHTCGMPALAYVEGTMRYLNQTGGTPLPIAGSRDVITFLKGSDDWAHFPPGKHLFYFNEGYVLLSEIITNVSGLSYAQYIREHIFEPLGMSRCFFSQQEVEADGQLAVPYILPKEQPARRGAYQFGVLSGDGAMFANVLDLARYLSMFLRRGNPVLTEASYNSMVHAHVPLLAQPLAGILGIPGADTRYSQYGYGLRITPDFLGHPLFEHSGSITGATGNIAFYPHANIAVAVLTNANGYSMAQIAKAALATMLGKSIDSLPFARLDGIFTDLCGVYETYRGTVRIKISRENDFLRLEYLNAEGAAPCTLVPENLQGPQYEFFTCTDGLRFPIQFLRGGNTFEMIFDRYKFRRCA